MTDSRPSARDIKALVRRLEDVGDVDVPGALARLANHEAAVRMLAGAQDVGEQDVRRALAELAGLVTAMRQWAAPAARKPVAVEAAEPAPPAHDDPSVLADHDKVKVFVDGAAKGNPGPASYGVVITDLEGATLFEDGCAIGHATSNVAEYRALIGALQTLVDNGRPEAYVFSDSTLLVNQMKGAWKVKSPGIMPLISEAQALRRLLPRFRITHVRREHNKRADELANLAFRQARDSSAM